MDFIGWVSVATVLIGAMAVWLIVARRRRVRSIGSEVAQARRAETDLTSGLTRSRVAVGGALRSLLGRQQIDDRFFEGLEEVLIGADVGLESARILVESVRRSDPDGVDDARSRLAEELRQVLGDRDRQLHLTGRPSVVLVVGVNGTGKTTSIAKLAKRLIDDGSSVLLGAADTFRAAADTQLRVWADRIGVEVVGGQTGADPAAVAFDAFNAARSRSRDVVLIDTAGRLHSKKNLMEELSKIRRVVEKAAGSISEVLLVLDATAGQNAIVQARQFTDVASVTGIVLTKLDGTAKGGVVVAIERELGIPVKFVGVGEGLDDLIPFSPSEFVTALIGEP